jgi:predicted permease
LDDEMREELEAHVAMRAAHDGTGEAAARKRVGNLLLTRESMRRVWIAEWLDTLRQDAHFTWRSWRRRPAFAVAAILVLALGLGASTALFAALDRVLFKPLPYADPERLVSVGLVLLSPGGSLAFEGMTETVVDTSYVQEWDTPPEPFQSVTAMGALVGARTCETADDQPEGLRCDLVERNFLQVLGVRVALGRDFTAEDDERGAPPVALISHALWVRRFGADPRVVNRRMSLDQGGSLVQARIIGVLPPEFEMPFERGDVLLPAQLRPLAPNTRFHLSLTVLARLRQDVTADQARLMLGSRRPDRPMIPGSGFRYEWRVRSLYDRRVGDAARVAWLLVGAVTIFLLIACVNVANLILARVAERQREFAVRAAVGASRLRLARLALAESVLLALAAGSAGLLLAHTLLNAFVGMAPTAGAVAQSVAQASIDMRVFAAAVLLIIVTGMGIGLWPAISVFRAGRLPGLRSTDSSASAAKPRVRFALVTTQIALTLALLGGSALLLRTLWNIVNVPLGFDAERVVTLSATLSRIRYPTTEQGAVFFDELLERARAMPGAVSVALSNGPPPPLLAGMSVAGMQVEGRPVEPNVPRPQLRFRSVTPRYFETLRIPVIRGRTFQDADLGGMPAVALNESAERALFGGGSALGRRIRFSALPSFPGQPVYRDWYTVVGVTANVRNGEAITDEPNPEIYFVTRPGRWVDLLPSGPRGVLSLRTAADPADTVAALRRIAADLDPKQLVTIQTQDELLTELTGQQRLIAWLLTAFGTLALLLAAAGLYSVVSYLVIQRRRDIGVRMAIGASPGDMARQVIREAGRWILAGALVGSALGWIGTRALQSQLYNVAALDPWSWTGALLLLALALLMAVLRPAYRAAHVDPVAALRSE